MIIRIAFALLVVLPCCCGAQEARREVALTFDDAPRADGPFLSGNERTDTLIDALASVGVHGAMFFIITGHLDREGEAGYDRVRRYVEAGHVLGNHSHSHLWAHRTPVGEYLADVGRAARRLEAFDAVSPYFRFPYLDEGREAGRREALRTGLDELGLKNGYVTVDNYDWYMDALAKEAVEAGHALDMDLLRDTYVELLVDVVRFYDDMAVETLGRSPRHVLLLHENDLAAMFIDDLVRGLRADGWTIVPALRAFDDPIASEEPGTLFLGQGRVAAFARAAGREPDELVHLTENEDLLRHEFLRRGLLPAP